MDVVMSRDHHGSPLGHWAMTPTHTCENPYLCCGYGFFTGTGMGSAGHPCLLVGLTGTATKPLSFFKYNWTFIYILQKTILVQYRWGWESTGEDNWSKYGWFVGTKVARCAWSASMWGGAQWAISGRDGDGLTFGGRHVVVLLYLIHYLSWWPLLAGGDSCARGPTLHSHTSCTSLQLTHDPVIVVPTVVPVPRWAG